MNGAELAVLVADTTGLPLATVRAVMRALPGVIADRVASGGVVSWGGFGRFDAVVRPAGMRRNPATGEMVEKGESLKVRFKAAPALRGGL